MVERRAFSPKRACEVAQGAFLAAFGVEILRREPAGVGIAYGGPFLLREREPGRVAAASLNDHVVQEYPFVAEAQAQGCRARCRVQSVAFPLQAAVAQGVKDVAHFE